MPMSLRAPELWFANLDALTERLRSVLPERENRSLLIRELVQREAFQWLQSPYVIGDANKFVYVAANGDMFLHSQETLWFQKGRHSVFSRVSMNPRKEHDFELKHSDDPHIGESIRDQCLVNYFAIWGNTPEEASFQVDRLGITSKSAELVVDAAQGVTRTREVLIGNREYAQRDRGHDAASDRASLSIDVPALSLSAAVLVDLALYSRASGRRETSHVGYELLNNERALLQTREFPSESCPITWHSGRSPGTLSRMEGPRDEVLGLFSSFKSRLQQLTKPEEKFEGRPIVSNDARDRLRSLRAPEEYLFGLLKWPLPLQGLTVGLTWTKPYERAPDDNE